MFLGKLECSEQKITEFKIVRIQKTYGYTSAEKINPICYGDIPTIPTHLCYYFAKLYSLWKRNLYIPNFNDFIEIDIFELLECARENKEFIEQENERHKQKNRTIRRQ